MHMHRKKYARKTIPIYMHIQTGGALFLRMLRMKLLPILSQALLHSGERTEGTGKLHFTGKCLH